MAHILSSVGDTKAAARLHEAASCPTCMGRRALLAGLAAGAGALAMGGAAWSAPATPRTLIDVHLHYGGMQMNAVMKANSFDPANRKAVANICLEQMDAGGGAMGIFSIGTEAPFKDPATMVKNARALNEAMAADVADHPDRLRFFASLPLPNMDASLKEMEYALDTLKASGVHLFTSNNGVWMGDPTYDPLFAELNRRKVVVKTHPRPNPCCTIKEFPTGIIELGSDTGRAITRMLLTGSCARYPGMKLIWSHLGGILLGIVQRFVGEWRDDPKFRKILPMGPEYELKKFYYDTAQAYSPATLAAAKEFIPISQILFGTDFPFVDTADTIAGIRNSGLFSKADLEAIGHGNARRLLNLPV